MHFDDTTLRALRAKIGVSQATLAGAIGVSRLTLSRIEKRGTGNPKILSAILAIIEDSSLTPAKRGRPAKTWRLYRPKRHYAIGRIRSTAGAYDNARIKLWRPGRPDHFCWLQSAPSGIGDEWLERVPHMDNPPKRAWELYKRGSEGEPMFRGLLDIPPDIVWPAITKT